MRYFCKNQRRRAQVRDTKEAGGAYKLNGIDYIEVTDDQQVLVLYFLHDVIEVVGGVRQLLAIAPGNIKISGGTRITNIRAINVEDTLGPLNAIKITLSQWGDFSDYQLQLVTSATDPQIPGGLAPPLDTQLATITFSFKVDCPNPFDCPQPLAAAPFAYPPPQIDYLSKDYASFRQMMLDRLSVTLPTWTERNPADVGVALVEVLAYAADRLSYYQDAAATEAYLETARQRASVRRHARLLNYSMHEGCNARTWIQVQTNADNVLIPKGTLFLTQVVGQPTQLSAGSRAYQMTLEQQPEGFESIKSLFAFQSHSQIAFYTWSDEGCCLPKGATHATLLDNIDQRLHLMPGDVLVLEESRSSTTGLREDADIARRWAVRLVDVQPETTEKKGVRSPAPIPKLDPLTDLPVVEVTWHLEDALPFDLPISSQQLRPQTDPQGSQMAVARGNIVLADHGRKSDDPKLTPDAVTKGVRYRPLLSDTNITYVTELKPAPVEKIAQAGQSATLSVQQDPKEALPAITLQQQDGQVWLPARDLLNSDRFDPKFVVEPDTDYRATLRFGDGVQGQQPSPQTQFEAIYRVGNGVAGNIGAEAIAHIVTEIPYITAVSNRTAGVGGTEPESIATVKLDAPQAFRVQQRAVTEADYAAVATRHANVQQAQATRRWTGSWYTYFITVDRQGGRPIDAEFEQDLRLFLNQYRLAGYDIEVDGPQFVSLDICFSVCVQPGYFSADVYAALLKTFSSHIGLDGQPGFFHPDRFTFGQPVYLSALIAAAMAVPGVAWVDASDRAKHRFQRWGRAANGELAQGEIDFSRLEIARLDNDANRPENGRIEFLMEGER
ncbi:MAG: putative baseplate assembly protein [Parerythrobacter sp.]